MLAFFQTVFTFYHQGFELAKDFDHYKRELQINIQNVNNTFFLPNCYHDSKCLYMSFPLHFERNRRKVLSVENRRLNLNFLVTK